MEGCPFTDSKHGLARNALLKAPKGKLLTREKIHSNCSAEITPAIRTISSGRLRQVAIFTMILKLDFFTGSHYRKPELGYFKKSTQNNRSVQPMKEIP